MSTSRRKMLISSAVTTTAVLLGVPAFAALPPLGRKAKYKVGFAQSESNSPWRIAETKSMRDEAARLGQAARPPTKRAVDVDGIVDIVICRDREVFIVESR